MKKLIFLLTFLTCSFLSIASQAIDFDGIGAKVAFVIPEGPIDNAVGFGVVATLGSIVRQITALRAEASADYWGKTYTSAGSDIKFTSLSFNGTAKYYFSSGRIMPFAGVGFGLVFSRSSFEVKGIPGISEGSETEVDPGLHLCGGVDIPIGTGNKLITEGRYTKGGSDTFQIIATFLVKLK